MYRHILVALDGSAEAEQVLPHVEALAGQFDADLLLLQAVTPPERILATAMDSSGGMAFDPEPLLEAEEAEQEDAESYLKSVAARLGVGGLRVTIEAPEADAAEAITTRARDTSADLIAMTTHGRSGIRHLLFGSVAEAVVKNTPCPVLLVRVKHQD